MPDAPVAARFVPQRSVDWRRENKIPKSTFTGWVNKGIVRTAMIGGQRYVLESLADVAEREAANQALRGEVAS